MPVVRNGRNEVDEYRVEPVGSPPGPVVRDRVSEARMADFAAERARTAEHDRRELSTAEKSRRAREIAAASRARGAKAGGFVKGATKPHQAKRTEEETVSPTKREERRIAKRESYLEAIRATTSHGEAAERLGVTKHTVEQFVSELRRRGELPADVDAMLRARNPANVHNRAHVEPESPWLAHDPTIQGGEEGAPATAAAPVEPDAPPAPAGVATPPSPPPTLTEASSASWTFPSLVVEGEDRCDFARVLTTSGIVHLCDRAAGHPGAHRGRLLSIRVTDQAIALLGYTVAVAS